MKRTTMVAGLAGIALAMATSAGVSHAQSIYKCQGSNGVAVYTDTPCDKSPFAKAGATQKVIEIPLDQKIANLKDMLINGRDIDAASYAKINGLTDMLPGLAQAAGQERQQRDWQRARDQARQRAERERAEELEAAAQIRATYNENARLRDQNAALQGQAADAQTRAMRAKRQAQASEAAANAARVQAQAAQSEADSPHYNPQTGQWCQADGGAVYCH